MLEDTISQYSTELEEDTTISPVGIKEKQLRLPSIKHKWTARLIRNKSKAGFLKREKDARVQSLLEGQKNEQAQRITKTDDAILRKKIQSTQEIRKLQQDIEDIEVLIDYLERVEKILSTMTYDVKNVIELMKMEIS